MSNENSGPATPGNGTGGVTRIGNAERQSAVALLEVHWHAGRLDPGEHELRVTRARSAVTQADLDDVFIDLPQVGTDPEQWVPESRNDLLSGGANAGDDCGVSGVGARERAQSSPTGVSRGDRGPRGGVRETLVALMPFVALLLFFTTHTWLWFLLVPVAGIVLYGADGNPNGRHGWFWGRNRNRGR